jgi:membrane protease YdiL (CAAX protease family)
MATLGVVMAFDPASFVFFSIFLLPRILGSLWVYFKVDNMWGNEVGFMALVLLSPIIGLIVYLAYAKDMRLPPRGFEYATIVDGVVHQPLYKYVGPAHPEAAPAQVQAYPSQSSEPPQQGYQPPPPHQPPPVQQPPYQQPPYQQPPYQQPPYQQPPYQQPPYQQPPYQQPPYQQPPYQQPQYQHPPYRQPPYQQPQYQQPQQPQYQQPYQQPPYQQPYQPPPYQQQPYQRPYGPPQAQQQGYGQDQYGHGYPPQAGYPSEPARYPYQPPRPIYEGPGPEWKKVGERLVQKRDYLVWHNVILLIISAMMLATYVLGIIIYPFIFSFDGFDEGLIEEIPTNALFVLFTLIIQDGILIWMVWHQVVRRKVIPLSEMGISWTMLQDGPRMTNLIAKGIGFGLAFFAIAFAIELGQSAAGFVPPEDAVVIGPGAGDVGAYLIWLISACIIAPVSEEFFFRGYAFYAFNKRHGLYVALFVSSLGFSAIHGSIYSLLPIFVAGIGLALAYYWTDSLVPPIVAHAVNNFIAVTLMYTGYYG